MNHIYAAYEGPAPTVETDDLPVHRRLDVVAARLAVRRVRERSGDHLEARIAAGMGDARRLRADAFRHTLRRLIRWPGRCLRALTGL